MRGAWQRRIRVAALLADHRTPAIHRAAVRQGCFHVGVVHPREVEHVARQFAGQLDDIGGAASRENLDGFLHLKGVPDLSSQRYGHVGEEGARGDPRVTAKVHHRAGKLARGVQVLHESTRPYLHIQDEGARALGDLLAHDRAGDERNRLHRRSNITQGVEPLVSGCQAQPPRR